MHECAPRPSLSELTGVVVAIVVGATAGARVDWAAFVATLRWCARSLEKLGATGWLLGMLAGGGKVATATQLLRWSEMRKWELKG